MATHVPHHRLHFFKRRRARRLAVNAARLALHHAGRVHYTQGYSRWNGIRNHRLPKFHHYPHYADCSAFVTWCLWVSLHANFGIGDVVNGANWQAGYTGTLLQHGRVLNAPSRLGDVVIYGQPGSTGSHTAIYVGGGKVISHGSEGGPYLLPWRYRSDVQSVRRFI